MEHTVKEFINSEDINNQLLNLRQLVFEVIDSCNLNCKYCAYGEFYDDYDKRNTTSLQLNKALLLLDYLKEIWLSNHSLITYKKTFISFYGGEPLMNFDFIQKVIEYVSNLRVLDKQFVFSMTTNGLLINKYIDFLAAKNIQLLISLDGNKHNNSYRVDHSGKNSFDRVVNNIEIIRKKYPKYYNEKVNFNAVLHNRNGVEEIFSFIKKEFGKSPLINELNPTGLKKDKVELFWNTYKNKASSLESSDNRLKLQDEMFLEAPRTRELALFIHNYSGNVFNTYNDLFFDDCYKKQLPTGTCLPFGRKMFVTAQGKILPCEKIGHQYALGYISDRDVNLDTQEIAKRYNFWFSSFENQCSLCSRKKGCVQCIFNIDNFEQKPICTNIMKENNFLNYLSLQYNYLREFPYLYNDILKNSIIE